MNYLNSNITLGIIIGIIITIVTHYLIQYFYQPYCYDLNTIINILIRQAARWSTAANQDDNSIIAILHANYGASYLWAVKSIASDSQIVNATGINLQQFEKEIVTIQDNSTQKLVKHCPSIAPTSYLATIGGEK